MSTTRVLAFEIESKAAAGQGAEAGPFRWGIACADIVEVLPAVRWRPFPDAPAWALGLFERQHSLLPLLDGSLLLGGPPARILLGSRIVIARLAPERADGGLGGILLPWTLGLEEVRFDSDGAHVGYRARPGAPFGAVAIARGVTVQRLHPDRLLTGPDRERLFAPAAGDVAGS
jgi:chemotaxis-related protein WspB